MEEKINEFLDRVLESKPDRKVNERFANACRIVGVRSTEQSVI